MMNKNKYRKRKEEPNKRIESVVILHMEDKQSSSNKWKEGRVWERISFVGTGVRTNI